MKALKLVTTTLALVGVWMGTCSMAEAGGGDFCPKYPSYTDDPGGTKTTIFYWNLDPLQPGGRYVPLHFEKDKMRLGGPKPWDTVSFDQLQKYEPLLDDLRMAAINEKKVNVVWNDNTRQVRWIHVYWHVPC